MSRKSAPIPNGTSISEVPNGVTSGPTLISGPGAGQDGASQEEPQVDARAVIGKILAADAQGADQDTISNLAKEMQTASIPPELQKRQDIARLIQAIGWRANEDPSLVSTNPATGEKEGSITELATQVADFAGWDINGLIRDAKDEEKGLEAAPTGIPVGGGSTMIAQAAKNNVIPNNSKKKKKRGNPFKVLLGKVDKLVRHGEGDTGIVKAIQKIGDWDRDTIHKAIKIVKDNLEGGHAEKTEKKAFNMAVHIITSAKKDVPKEPKRESIYDIPRDLGLASTTELLMRWAYQEFAKSASATLRNENTSRSSVDTKAAAKEIKEIQGVLKARGYTSEELEGLKNSFLHPNSRNEEAE
jgi:hypothetical protein